MAEKQISLTDLNSGQLQEVKRQLEEVRPAQGNPQNRCTRSSLQAWVRDQEIEHLSTSFGSLRSAQAKYRSCANDVQEMKPSTKGEIKQLMRDEVEAGQLINLVCCLRIVKANPCWYH